MDAVETVVNYGILSLVPPVLAIALALITKNIIVSLFVTVYVSATIVAGFNPLMGFTTMIHDYILGALLDEVNVQGLIMMTIIGGFVALLTKSGGAYAFTNKVTKWVNSRVKCETGIWIGGLIVWFTDNGNSLMVGPIFEALAEKLRVSREKFAYILDCTTTPICALVPIIGWGVYTQGLIDTELQNAAITNTNGFEIFTQCIPFNFYFLNKHYRWALPMIALTAAEFTVVALSHSRGALIFTVLTVALSLIVSLFRYRRNKIIWLCFSLCALALVFAVSRYGGAIKHLLSQTFEDKLGASSRDFLYLEALDRFRENPLFGAGMGYLGYRGTNSIIYLFHSTLFQTIGMLGAVGIVVMIYVYVMRYFTVLRKKDSFNLFLFIGLVGFEGYSMIDTGTFNSIPFLVMLAVLMAATELSNRQLDTGLLIEKQNYNDRLTQVGAGADNEKEE